eukprot:CAMPEP_0170511018 /NCGR_PEP_ID=MMETSP0208-20121228/66075_1 /TAXON_ID=197538 /ORGANISM="Strombidium inclinatum, Strain S3" /LENGTH=122 /DNA_ID=CAMNT_0010794521 /DNA_START=1255 /DNA_END=1623 /DNA_ORIENTATION=+
MVEDALGHVFSCFDLRDVGDITAEASLIKDLHQLPEILDSSLDALALFVIIRRSEVDDELLNLGCRQLLNTFLQHFAQDALRLLLVDSEQSLLVGQLHEGLCSLNRLDGINPWRFRPLLRLD